MATGGAPDPNAAPGYGPDKPDKKKLSAWETAISTRDKREETTQKEIDLSFEKQYWLQWPEKGGGWKKFGGTTIIGFLNNNGLQKLILDIRPSNHIPQPPGIPGTFQALELHILAREVVMYPPIEEDEEEDEENGDPPPTHEVPHELGKNFSKKS